MASYLPNSSLHKHDRVESTPDWMFPSVVVWLLFGYSEESKVTLSPTLATGRKQSVKIMKALKSLNIK